ncbi:MAG: c-type cytochrome [Chloroflexota bacterium]
MMKNFFVLCLVGALALILSACGSDASSETSIGVTPNADEPVAEDAPTQELTTLVAPNPTAVESGITPQEAVIIANVESADVEEGERLYTGALVPACTTCHLEADSSVRQVAPSLVGYREIAGTRVEGQDAYTYTYNAIRYANDYVVEGYQANVMPVYDNILTDQEVYDLIAYIWTLEADD